MQSTPLVGPTCAWAPGISSRPLREDLFHGGQHVGAGWWMGQPWHCRTTPSYRGPAHTCRFARRIERQPPKYEAEGEPLPTIKARSRMILTSIHHLSICRLLSISSRSDFSFAASILASHAASRTSTIFWHTNSLCCASLFSTTTFSVSARSNFVKKIK